MKKIFLLILIFFFIFSFSSCFDSCKSPQEISSTDNSGSCDTSLWKYVYNRDRLQLIKKCLTVSGTIEEIRKEKDGDDHILLKLDAGQDSLLTDKNKEKQNGDLVIEVVCLNTIKQEDAVNACKDCPVVQVWPRSSHVKVRGSYVIDRHHGWAEIHPVSKMELIK
ncbi:MAG: hypothetical protein HY063_00830 [Bacteroidetes bacterium]|nr:hypothetical protein [Bacteroidota bacterium]